MSACIKIEGDDYNWKQVNIALWSLLSYFSIPSKREKDILFFLLRVLLFYASAILCVVLFSIFFPSSSSHLSGDKQTTTVVVVFATFFSLYKSLRLHCRKSHMLFSFSVENGRTKIVEKKVKLRVEIHRCCCLRVVFVLNLVLALLHPLKKPILKYGIAKLIPNYFPISLSAITEFPHLLMFPFFYMLSIFFFENI